MSSEPDLGRRGHRPRNAKAELAEAQSPRVRIPPQARRELLLQEAAKAFGRHGYDGVSLDTIAGAANVTKPIVYRHFDSKDALYLALLEQHGRELPSFVRGLPDGLPLEQLLTRILEGWFAYAEANGDRWRMIFEDSGGGAEIKAARRRLREQARDVLAGFLEAHPAFLVAEQDLAATAEAIRGGLSALVLFGQDDPQLSRESLVRAGTRLVAGIAAQPPRSESAG